MIGWNLWLKAVFAVKNSLLSKEASSKELSLCVLDPATCFLAQVFLFFFHNRQKKKKNPETNIKVSSLGKCLCYMFPLKSVARYNEEPFPSSVLSFLLLSFEPR